MYFVQFFQRDLLGTLVEGLGDRAVLRVDGRVNKGLHHEWAREHAKRYKYEAYQLRNGTFSVYQNNSDRVMLNES